MKKTSIFISLILRHKPEVIGITLDAKGWADVNELIDGINATGNYRIDMQMLEEIVRTDNKQRYSFSEDKTKIRANQGHSVQVDVELKEKQPPEFLYHGTGEKYVDKTVYKEWKNIPKIVNMWKKKIIEKSRITYKNNKIMNK